MDKKIPRPGEIFSNEKGQKYQIVTIATHTVTKEKLVIYQALYGSFDVRALPVERFSGRKSEVDDTVSVKKSPQNDEIKEAVKKKEIKEEIKEEIINKCPDGMNPVLFAFLEAESIHDKLKIVRDKDNLTKIDNKCVDDMAACLDVTIGEGDIDTRISELISCLDTMKRFEVIR